MADGGISDIVEISRRAFAENSRQNEESSTSSGTGSFATLLQTTNMLFRRRENSQGTTPKRSKRRGRKVWSKTRITFVLMDDDGYGKVPSRAKLRSLKENGLGEKEAILSRLMPRCDLEDYLVGEYQELTHGFKFMMSSHSHWLRRVDAFEDVGELKKLIKKGRVYLLPPREITTVPSTSEASTRTEQPTCTMAAPPLPPAVTATATTANATTATATTATTTTATTTTATATTATTTTATATTATCANGGAARMRIGNRWPSSSSDSGDDFADSPFCPWDDMPAPRLPVITSRRRPTRPAATATQTTTTEGPTTSTDSMTISNPSPQSSPEVNVTTALHGGDLDEHVISGASTIGVGGSVGVEEVDIPEPDEAEAVQSDSLRPGANQTDQSHDFTEDIYERTDTPTVSFRIRPQRNAAAVARLRVAEWVDTMSEVRVSPSSTRVSRPPIATSARSDSPPIPEPLPEIFISDDAFESELVLNHGEEDTQFEPQPTTTKLSSALQSLAENVLGDNRDDGCLKVIVRRSTALRDALQNISRAQDRLMEPLSVRFIGESAVDDGGPSRELASLIVKQLHDSGYVEGREHNLSFTHDFQRYLTNQYLHLGQLTAVLTLQGGPGLPVFCHTVTEYLLSGSITTNPVDLPDSLRTAFTQLEEMSDHRIPDAVDDLFPSRYDEGYAVPSAQISRDKLPELVQAMVAHHIILPQKMALDQFTQGLQIGGVLQVLQEHAEDSSGLFRGSVAKLTMEVMENLVLFCYSDLDEGSNTMRIAQSIEQGWVLLLQAAESGEAEFQFGEAEPLSISLSQILQWLTGGSRLPAVGFPKKVDIYFDKVATLPKVNTCALDAYIPLLPWFEDPEIFMRQLVEWVIDSQGFGKV